MSLDDFMEKYEPDPNFTPVEKKIDQRLERDDWWRSESRREQVRLTVEKTLAKNSDRPVPERRLEAQKEVRNELNVRLQSVQQKCHEDLFKGYEYVAVNKWHRLFDQLIADIERSRVES